MNEYWSGCIYRLLWHYARSCLEMLTSDGSGQAREWHFFKMGNSCFLLLHQLDRQISRSLIYLCATCRIPLTARMSSLASQLKSIQAANTNDVNQLKHRPSYLFTPRQAATITKDEIYGLGQNGFQALLQLEPRLDRFEDIFFSDRARQTDRTLLSKEENEKLDLSVGACLRLLGPHVLIRPCGQLLEWLIRQFRINEFNVKNLVALVLPFHETPQFAQILQILNLE